MPCPEESGISIDREREVRGTYIGGFLEPERAIWGGAEALTVLCGKSCCAKSPASAEERFGESLLLAKIRLLYCTMVN